MNTVHQFLDIMELSIIGISVLCICAALMAKFLDRWFCLKRCSICNKEIEELDTKSK